MAKVLKYFQFVAITLGSAFIILLTLNISLWAIFKVKDKYISPIPDESHLSSIHKEIGDKYSIFRQLYTDLTDRDLNILLSESYAVYLVYESFAEFKEAPLKGKFVNIDPNGFRKIRDQGPWPPDPHDFVVFVFGGSTTFGAGVPDDQTIVSYLQETMRKSFSDNKSSRKVCMYNFGHSYYYSSQELALYQKLLRDGFIPNMAIFIDGLNDFYFIHGEPQYSNIRGEITDAFKKMKYQIWWEIFGKKLTIYRAVKDIQARIKNNDKAAKITDYKDPKLLEGVIHRYFENKEMIEAISSIHEVTPIFVWQPVPTFEYDLKNYIFSEKQFGLYTYAKYGYVQMAEKIKKNGIGNNFFWCADLQKDFQGTIYLDKVHYSPMMCKRIADRICDLLMSRKLIPQKFFN